MIVTSAEPYGNHLYFTYRQIIMPAPQSSSIFRRQDSVKAVCQYG